MDKKVKYVIVAAITALALFLVIRASSPGAEPQVESANSDILSVRDDDWIKGPKDASAVLVEYADFQCPACATYEPLISQLKEQKGDDMAIVFRHYPLVSIHRNALSSAIASEAAGRQGKFWEMHDQLFVKQEEWSNDANAKELFVNYAKELGLDVEMFRADMDSADIKDKVMASYAEGNQLKISGTPTFFVNGQRIQNPRSVEEFTQLVDQLSNPND